MIEYTVIRSDRKTVSIQVSENGEIVVRTPNKYPQNKVQEFVNMNIEWIKTAQEKQRENNDKKLILTDEEILNLKKYAEKQINDKLKYYSDVMGVKPNGVKITSAQKRFGSCNGKNSLCFSYILMLYPDEAVDYVIVHELAHIRFHNHSKDFYKFVSTVMPDYKRRENLLKGKQILPDFS